MSAGWPSNCPKFVGCRSWPGAGRQTRQTSVIRGTVQSHGRISFCRRFAGPGGGHHNGRCGTGRVVMSKGKRPPGNVLAVPICLEVLRLQCHEAVCVPERRNSSFPSIWRVRTACQEVFVSQGQTAWSTLRRCPFHEREYLHVGVLDSVRFQAAISGAVTGGKPLPRRSSVGSGLVPRSFMTWKHMEPSRMYKSNRTAAASNGNFLGHA